MEVHAPCSALLSSFEVYACLQNLEKTLHEEKGILKAFDTEERKARGLENEKEHVFEAITGRHGGGPQSVLVRQQALAYFAKPHCFVKEMSSEKMELLLKALLKYDLTKAEKLGIVDQLPRQTVELYTIVESIEDRFDENSIQEILDTVVRLFPVSDA